MCNVIEDETHFLINCSKHDTERIPLFVNMQQNCVLFNNLTSIEKMIYVMSTCDENSITIKQISHFLYICKHESECINKSTTSQVDGVCIRHVKC